RVDSKSFSTWFSLGLIFPPLKVRLVDKTRLFSRVNSLHTTFATYPFSKIISDFAILTSWLSAVRAVFNVEMILMGFRSHGAGFRIGAITGFVATIFALVTTTRITGRTEKIVKNPTHFSSF
ncbi:MAG TPA: hypothetical protein VF837_01855, partial [Patescibacteria group bacterium]